MVARRVVDLQVFRGHRRVEVLQVEVRRVAGLQVFRGRRRAEVLQAEVRRHQVEVRREEAAAVVVADLREEGLRDDKPVRREHRKTK